MKIREREKNKKEIRIRKKERKRKREGFEKTRACYPGEDVRMCCPSWFCSEAQSLSRFHVKGRKTDPVTMPGGISLNLGRVGFSASPPHWIFRQQLVLFGIFQKQTLLKFCLFTKRFKSMKKNQIKQPNPTNSRKYGLSMLEISHGNIFQISVKKTHIKSLSRLHISHSSWGLSPAPLSVWGAGKCTAELF